MADWNIPTGRRNKKKSGVKKSKKLSTRVDLTPMVDLGFLLITFFIFTTTWRQPKSIHWILPKSSIHPIEQKESAVITLLPSENDQLFYYEGMDLSHLQKTSFYDLRKIIRSKQIRTNPEDFMVLLKPTPFCSFKNTIALFDEMAINQVRRYVLADLSPEELIYLNQYGK
jgi:biopolymer transport protein ExbD